MSQSSIPSRRDSQESSTALLRKDSQISVAAYDATIPMRSIEKSQSSSGLRSQTSSLRDPSHQYDSMQYIGRSSNSSFSRDLGPVDTMVGLIGRGPSSQLSGRTADIPRTPSLISSTKSAELFDRSSVDRDMSYVGRSPVIKGIIRSTTASSFSSRVTSPSASQTPLQSVSSTPLRTSTPLLESLRSLPTVDPLHTSQRILSSDVLVPKSPPLSDHSQLRTLTNDPPEVSQSLKSFEEPLHSAQQMLPPGTTSSSLVPKSPPVSGLLESPVTDLYGSPSDVPVQEMQVFNTEEVVEEERVSPTEEEFENRSHSEVPPLLDVLTKGATDSIVLRSQPTSVAESYQQQDWFLSSQPVSEINSEKRSVQEGEGWKLSSEPPTSNLPTPTLSHHSVPLEKMESKVSQATNTSDIRRASISSRSLGTSKPSQSSVVPLTRKVSHPSGDGLLLASTVSSIISSRHADPVEQSIREAMAEAGSIIRETNVRFNISDDVSVLESTQVKDTTISTPSGHSLFTKSRTQGSEASGRSEILTTLDTDTETTETTNISESESIFTEEAETEEERVPTIDGGINPVVGRHASEPAKREDLTNYTAVFGQERLSLYRQNPIKALDINSANVIQDIAAEFMDEIDNLKLTLISVTKERDDLKEQNAHLLDLLGKRSLPDPVSSIRPQMPIPLESQRPGAVGGVLLNWVAFQKQLRAAQAEAAALRAELTTQEILASRAALAENALQRAEIVIAEAQQAYDDLADCREGDIKSLSAHNRGLLSAINSRVPREEFLHLQKQLQDQETAAAEQAKLSASEQERLLKEAQDAQFSLASLEREFSEREAALRNLLRASGDEQHRLLQQLLMKEREMLPGIRDRLEQQRIAITNLLNDKKLLIQQLEESQQSVEASETLAECTETERAELSKQLKEALLLITTLEDQLQQALADAKEVPSLRHRITLLEKEIERLKEEIQERDRKYLRFQDLLDELGVKHKLDLERAVENAISRTRAEAGEIVGRQCAAIEKLKLKNNTTNANRDSNSQVLGNPPEGSLIRLLASSPGRCISPVREPMDRTPL